MEDIRLGRKTRYAVKVVTIAVGSVQNLVPFSAGRVYLAVHVSANQIRIAPDGVDITSSGGIVVSSSPPPFIARIETYGQAVMAPWGAIAAVGPSPVLVIEGFLEDI
jgi:hypothetical protein